MTRDHRTKTGALVYLWRAWRALGIDLGDVMLSASAQIMTTRGMNELIWSPS